MTVDEVNGQIPLTSEAMSLAHDIALQEASYRELGRTPDRIKSSLAREFGPKIARLAIKDPSALYIYRPPEEWEEMQKQVGTVEAPTEGDDLTTVRITSVGDRLAWWAQYHTERGGGDWRAQAYKD